MKFNFVIIKFIYFIIVIISYTLEQEVKNSNEYFSDGLIWSLFYTDQGNTTYFEFLTKLDQPNNKWTAFAFSNDQIMNNDTVCMCKYVSENEVSIEHYYNVNKSIVLLDLNNSKIGISNPIVSYQNGILNCSFNRKKSMPNINSYFSLYNNTAYVLTAFGQNAKGFYYYFIFTNNNILYLGNNN